MILFNLAYSILLPTCAGYFMFALLMRRCAYPVLFNCAVGYTLGMGLLAQWMLILGILRISYNVFSISLPLAGLLVVLVSIYKRWKPEGRVTLSVAKSPGAFWINFLWIYIFVKLAIYVWMTMTVPFYEWDVVATHAFTGKIIFWERSIAFQPNFPHNMYPLQIPFIEAWVSFNLGCWDDQLLKVIFLCSFFSFIIICYYYFAIAIGRSWGVIVVALLMSSGFMFFHAQTGYRDFMEAVYLSSVFIFLLFWYRRQEDSWIWLAGLFSGFMSFVKLEGTGYIFVHAFFFFLLLRHAPGLNWKQGLVKLLKFLVLPCAIAGLYLIYKYFRLHTHVSTLEFSLRKIAIDFSFESFKRIPYVIREFVECLFFSGNFNVIWMLCAISYMISQRCRNCLVARPLFWSILVFMGIYFVGFTFTQHYVWLAQGVIARAILHIFPVAVFSIGIILSSFHCEE